MDLNGIERLIAEMTLAEKLGQRAIIVMRSAPKPL